MKNSLCKRPSTSIKRKFIKCIRHSKRATIKLVNILFNEQPRKNQFAHRWLNSDNCVWWTQSLFSLYWWMPFIATFTSIIWMFVICNCWAFRVNNFHIHMVYLWFRFVTFVKKTVYEKNHIINKFDLLLWFKFFLYVWEKWRKNRLFGEICTHWQLLDSAHLPK